MPSADKRRGVYALFFPSGAFYVGSSGYLGERWFRHRTMMRAGTHRCPLVMGEYRAYGEPEFHVLAVTETKEDAICIEQWLLDGVAKHELCLNSAMDARNSTAGTRQSDSTRAKILDRVKKSPVVAAGETFPSVIEASRKIGLSRSTIRKRISDGTPGFHYA